MNHYNFFGRSVAMGMMIIMVSQGAQAAVRTWTGGAGSVNLNVPGNWTTNPVSGDSWVFGSVNGGQGETLNNDFTGYTVAGITFSSDARSWTINGNAITLSGGITVETATSEDLNVDFTLNGATNITVNGTGSLSVGTLSMGGKVLHKFGTGALTVSRGFSGSSNFNVYLDAGQLSVGDTPSSGNMMLHIGDGTSLDAAGSSVTIISGQPFTIDGSFSFLGSGDLTLSAGGSGFALTTNSTISVSDKTLTLVKAVSGAFSITKAGAGTLALSAANTYSGTTTVSSGRLNMIGSVSNSSVIVASGGTLGGEGAVSSLVLSNANLRVDGSTSNAMTCVTNTTAPGTLTLSGTTTVYLDGVSATTGSVRVLNYYGALTGGTNNLVLGDAVNYRAYAFSTATVNQVNLDVGAKALTWSGATAAWDIGNSTNWNSGADKYYDGDVVTFTNSGTSKTVSIDATVRPGAVIFNHASGTNYTLSGTGGIAGTAGLTKRGNGTLTITNANLYSGATAVSAGTMVLSGSLSNTPITVSSVGIFTQTVSGAIAGSSSLTCSGSGTNTLTGMNTYTGATTISVGSTLALSGNGALAGGGDLKLGVTTTGGTLQYYSSATSTFSAILIGDGGSGGSNYLYQTKGTINGSSLNLGTKSSDSTVGQLQISGGAMNISGVSYLQVSAATTASNIPISSIVVSGTGEFSANGGLVLSAYSTPVRSSNNKFSQNAGAVTVSGAGGLQLLNAGATNTVAPRRAEYDLNGGMLNVNTLTNGSISDLDGLGAFLFNGGTLRPTTSSSSFWVNSAYTTAMVTNGGAIIDTIGYNITIAQPLVNAAGSTNASLIKLGAGTLTLAGANTYNGATIVSNGVLAVAATGNLGNSAANTLSLITGAQLNLGTAVTARFFRVDGVLMAQGSWGSTSSSAAHQNNSYFSGSGMLTVLEQGSALGTMIRIH